MISTPHQQSYITTRLTKPRGFSGSARKLDTHVTPRAEDTSQTFGIPLRKALSQLTQATAEADRENCSGKEAVPVTAATVAVADQFLNALPQGLPAPTCATEPDGQIVFEWYHSTRRLLSVSVSSRRELHYASLFGSSKAYGTEPFFDTIPETILSLIAKVAP